MCVMLQAFAPSGDRIAARYVDALQSHIRAQIDTIEPATAPARPTPTQRVRQARGASAAPAR
jgi:hypothetical protein